jgi:hypothetical protein
VVIRIQSNATNRTKENKRLTSNQVSYQPDKKKRETYYRNQSERLRESVRKLGNYTGCYGILYLHRKALFLPINLLCRNVSDPGKGKETPVIFTTAIHDNPGFKGIATECMSKIVDFETEFRATQQLRYRF